MELRKRTCTALDKADSSAAGYRCNCTGPQFVPHVEYEKVGDSPIARGGFGEVWKAKHKVTGELIAAKLIPNQYHFRCEHHVCQVLLTDPPPHVIRFIGAFPLSDDPHVVYLCFEWAPDGTLWDFISEKRTEGSEFTVADIRNYARQILEGLCYVLKKGYLHRDLKSPNILALNSRKDLGFWPCEGGSIDSMDGDCGTPAYIAPEVRRSGHSRYSDIWAFGCVLYELATLYVPWRMESKGGYSTRTYLAQNAGDPEFHPPIPDDDKELEQLLEQCFVNTNPKLRGTCEELLRHPFFETLEQRAPPPVSTTAAFTLSCSHWFEVGSSLLPGETANIEGREYNQVDCYTELVKQLEGKNPEAWDLLAEAIQNNPSVPTDYTPLRCYTEALELSPYFTIGWTGLSKCLTEAGSGEIVTVNGRCVDGTDCYTRALACQAKQDIEKQTAGGGPWFRLGEVLFLDAQRNFDVAGTVVDSTCCFRRALELEPSNATAWSNLGFALVVDGENSVAVGGEPYSAQRCFVRALELEPAKAKWWHNLGFAQLATEEPIPYSSAKECFVRALELEPGNDSAWNSLGLALAAGERIAVGGEPYSAKECLVRALELEPANAAIGWWWNNLGLH